jgi:DNA-directed RNA polymerase subunit L
MQVDLLKKEKDTLELKISEYANYNVRHPQLDTPVFYLQVRSGKPQNAFKKAAKALSNTYKDMLTQFNKQS